MTMWTRNVSLTVLLDPPILNFFIIAVDYVNTPKYFIFPDYSFKVSEKPSKCTVNVRIVIVVSAQSMTTPTQCPRSQPLCQHRVFIVNNYTDMVSKVNDYVDMQFSKSILKAKFCVTFTILNF